MFDTRHSLRLEDLHDILTKSHSVRHAKDQSQDTNNVLHFNDNSNNSVDKITNDNNSNHSNHSNQSNTKRQSLLNSYVIYFLYFIFYIFPNQI